MSRRRTAEKRQINPDAKFGDLVLAKFINNLMYAGKKSAAERVVYGALDLIEEEGDAASNEKGAIGVFHAALNNIRPEVEVRSRRVGGATYQVPTEVRNDRQMALAIRWLITDMRGRPTQSGGKGKKNSLAAARKLKAAVVDAANNRGGAIKKREDTHKMAEANKAFSHYRW